MTSLFSLLRSSAAILASMAMAAQATVPLPNMIGNASEESFDTIEVTAIDSPLRFSAKQVRAAMTAYGRDKKKFAPEAALLLTPSARSEAANLNGMKLRLVPVDPEKDIIELDRDPFGRFIVPSVDYGAGGYELMANRRSADVKIMLSALSPGTSEADRRLGDLRLECAMGWAMAKLDNSPVFMTLISMAGGACNTKRVAIYFPSPRALAGVSVVSEGQEQAVPVGRTKLSYRPPVYAKNLSNSARLKFKFED